MAGPGIELRRENFGIKLDKRGLGPERWSRDRRRMSAHRTRAALIQEGATLIMMTVFSSPASPFGRKAVIAAALAGLSGKIKVVAADTGNPDDPVRGHNPLGKIPTLVLEDGSAVFDSRVIVEYFDVLAGPGALIPASPAERFKSLTLAALADGIADASLLQIYEIRFREASRQDPKWIAHQADKVARGLRVLEAAPPAGRRDVAHISVACALGYLDLRFEGVWRRDHPNLVRWLDGFASEIPAFEATRI